MSGLKLRNSASLQAPVSSMIAAWQLAKVPLCLLIAFSTVFGASLVPDVTGLTILNVACGVFFLAMGGATLNSFQERATDFNMKRTANRPLVCNHVSPSFALFLSVVLIVLGFSVLCLLKKPFLPIFLGTVALVIYNGVYTRLKQHTLLAILPGAICGGLPPVIGWAGAGGILLSYMTLLLFMLLFIWQVPHFCLILLRYRDDYLHVDQPSFIKLLSETGVRRISTIWCCGLALVMMLFTTTTAAAWSVQKYLLITNALFLAGFTLVALLRCHSISYRTVFIYLNIALFNHMSILVAGSFLP